MLYALLKKYFSHLISALFFTTLGYFIGFINSTEEAGLFSHETELAAIDSSIASQTAEEKSPRLADKKKVTSSHSPSYKKSALQFTVDNSDNEALVTRISTLFPNADVRESIDDIRLFANRLVAEIDSNTLGIHNDSLASISFSLSADIPTSTGTTFNVSSKQVIYAHININGGLGANSKKFFIKWVNLDSGEILLFTPKRINSNSDANWVSLIPEVSWGDHNYEVSFYDYSSELNKLASTTYTTYVH